MGLAFYTGSSFPAEYRGNAFVALHGSWNAGNPTGYKVVRVRFENGKPVNAYENFATGFWNGMDRPGNPPVYGAVRRGWRWPRMAAC